MEPITVLFFGTQGSGKGTQVKLLMEFLNKNSDRGIIHIDMGAELRAMIAEGTFSSPLVKAVLDAGNRMPDFMPTYLQTKKIVNNFTGSEHIIADGLARGPDQTKAFDDMMAFYGRPDYHIVSLKLSEKSAIERLLARGRHDDTEDGIRSRLGWNEQITMPQLDLLRSRGRTVHAIDGEPDIDTVHKHVLAALKLI